MDGETNEQSSLELYRGELDVEHIQAYTRELICISTGLTKIVDTLHEHNRQGILLTLDNLLRI